MVKRKIIFALKIRLCNEQQIPFEDMEEVMDKYQIKNGRFTDINVGFKVDPNDTRTDKEVLADMEKAGTKVIRLDKLPTYY